MKRLLCATAVILLLLPGSLFAQMEAVIDLLQNGQTDSAQVMIRDLQGRLAADEIQFLRALAEVDGSQAVAAYEALLVDYPQYAFTDFIRLRLGQAYYAQAGYQTALSHFKKMLGDHPRSRPRAYYWMGRSYQALGLTDSAALAYDQVIRDNSSSALSGKARHALDGLGADAPNTQIDSITPPAEPAKPWTVQVGAFSNQARAIYKKSFFEDRGYTGQLGSKKRDSVALHLVWIGAFRTRDEARRLGEELRRKYGTDFTLVRMEE